MQTCYAPMHPGWEEKESRSPRKEMAEQAEEEEGYQEAQEEGYRAAEEEDGCAAEPREAQAYYTTWALAKAGLEAPET